MSTVEEIKQMFPEVDLEELREKCAHERARRATDSRKLYKHATGELAEYAEDPYTPSIDRAPVTDHVEVLVLGGGLSGICISSGLRKEGVESLRILDEAGDFGGVWYWNRYPGARCDIESHVYLPLLEEVGHVPTERYATSEEIRGHLQTLARKFDLYRDVLFHTQATQFSWSDGAWRIRTNRGDNFTARNIIIAVGPTAILKMPDIPGIETFKGKLFHSSRWDYDYTGGDQHGGLTGLEGKKVAVIGTGATGIQIIPEVAKYADHLYVLQRTPANVAPRDNCPTGEDWVEDTAPGWQARRMDNFQLNVTGADIDEDVVDDGWTQNKELLRRYNTGTHVSQYSGEVRELHEEYLDARAMNASRARVDAAVHDPKVAELLKPWYRWACKRPNFSDSYLDTFNKENVTLVDTADFGGVTRVTETSLWVGDTEYPVDLIVVATGFELGRSGVITGELPVIGRKERSLLEKWKEEGMRLLHGYLVHEFPNFFLLGPTQSVNSVNIAHVAQLHGEHVVELISAARKAGEGYYVEPSEEQQEEWFSTVAQNTRRDLKDYQSMCTPGNLNGDGKPRDDAQYGPGPIPFREILTEWRTTRIHEVLRTAEDLGVVPSEVMNSVA